MTIKSKLVCPTKDPIQANLFFQPINDEYYGSTHSLQTQKIFGRNPLILLLIINPKYWMD